MHVSHYVYMLILTNMAQCIELILTPIADSFFSLKS